MRRKPRNRYHSIADARIDIEVVLNDPEGLQARSDTHEIISVRPRLRWLAATVVLTAAISGLLAWVLQPTTEPPQVNRFDFVLPDGQTLRGTGRPVIAISPTGRQFVYNSVDGLYLRAMGELEARLIPGTESQLFFPVFSPDGREVAYWTEGQLKRIAISGGAPVVITDVAQGPDGLSWAVDGTILFGQDEGIYRVPATGGTPELIIPAPTDESRTRVFDARLLPDGDSVLFNLGPPGDWDLAQIIVQSLSTGERKVLIQGGADPRYLPTGHIVYVLGDGLFAVTFDLENLTVFGGAVPLVQGVMRTGGGDATANYGVSEDGTLAYVTGSVVGGDRTLVWVDRDGAEEAISIEPSNYFYPRISPDGTRVALDDRNSDGDLWIWDFAGETRTRLIVEQGGAYPAWTPDSERIAYGANGSAGVYWKAANNTGTWDPLDGLNANPYFFSPSGTELVFRASASSETGNDIGMITIGEDAEPVWLLQGLYQERNAELSPDGRWMAYQSDESGQWEIYVRPFPNVDDDQVPISNASGFHPLWSRDGRELFYIEEANQRRLMSVSVEATETGFSFGTRTAILDWPYFGGSYGQGRPYAVADDGQFLAINQSSSQESTTQIVIVQNWLEELKRLAPLTE